MPIEVNKNRSMGDYFSRFEPVFGYRCGNSGPWQPGRDTEKARLKYENVKKALGQSDRTDPLQEDDPEKLMETGKFYEIS